MENQEYLQILAQGAETWNKWREENPKVKLDFSDARFIKVELKGIDFRDVVFSNEEEFSSPGGCMPGAIVVTAERGAFPVDEMFHSVEIIDSDLTGANLAGADLRGARIIQTNLSEANLSKADLRWADLRYSDFRGANLSNTRLNNANLTGANLSSKTMAHFVSRDGTSTNTITRQPTNLFMADLRGADLSSSNLVEANLEFANITDCFVYGVSAWNLNVNNLIQENLVVTPHDQIKITVDNIEVAQFIHLLLDNKRMQNVITTITAKVVLILGSFAPGRIQVLNALRDNLRKYDLLPVVFDFKPSPNQDLTETVSTLAHLARFIVVDLTHPSSVPHELATIAPHCIRPIQPLIYDQAEAFDRGGGKRREYALFYDLRRRYHWVLETFRYKDTSHLLASLQEFIIQPAEEKAKELEIGRW